MKIVAPNSRLGFHEIGYCVTGDDTNHVFVPIPKNGSTYTEKLLQTTCGWDKIGNIFLDSSLNDKIKIVTLRDPYKRYISGMIEHFFLNKAHLKFDDDNLNYVFNQFTLDIHTELQVRYLADLDTEKCLFLYMDNRYNDTLKTVIQDVIGKPLEKDEKIIFNTEYNSTQSNRLKKIMLGKFTNYIAQNKKKLHALRTYLKPDYHLIRNINFYNRKSFDYL